MEYYIDPKMFYLLEISGNLKILCIALIIILGIGSAILIGLYFSDDWTDCEEDNRILNTLKKCIKAAMIAVVISIIGAVFIPNSDTCLKMAIAKVVTKENVAKGVETTKDVIDYIVDKIKEIKE